MIDIKGFCLPIMIGCYDKPDKCSVIAKDKKYGGYSLFICRLKKGVNLKFGDETPMDAIGKVICHIHFCKLEAAKSFLHAVETLVSTWEREYENNEL